MTEDTLVCRGYRGQSTVFLCKQNTPMAAECQCKPAWWYTILMTTNTAYICKRWSPKHKPHAYCMTKLLTHTNNEVSASMWKTEVDRLCWRSSLRKMQKCIFGLHQELQRGGEMVGVKSSLLYILELKYGKQKHGRGRKGGLNPFWSPPLCQANPTNKGMPKKISHPPPLQRTRVQAQDGLLSMVISIKQTMPKVMRLF